MLACILLISQTAMLNTVMAGYHFVKQPSDTDVIEGMSLEFQCEAIVNSFQDQNYAIHWQLNGGNFREVSHSQYGIKENKNSDRYNLCLSSILTIFNVSLQDGGSYHCYLYSTVGSALIVSNNATVSVTPKPRFLREPKNVSAIEGRITTLLCRIQAVDSSVMSVKWTKYESDLVSLEDNNTSLEGKGHDDRYSIIGGNHLEVYHLQILKVRRSDAGMFNCNVYLKTSGEVILKSSEATVDVLFPPNETYPSCRTAESKNYSAGDTLTTECISRGGKGPLRLSWLRNGEEKNGTRVHNKHPDIRDTWTLTAADNGAYLTCVMTGTAVLHRRHCTIGPLQVYFEPKIVIKPRRTRVCKGQTMTFRCSANANPPITATYSWFLEGQKLDNPNSNLTINRSKIDDYIASNTSEINVTCTDVNYQVSDSAILRIDSLTTVHVASLPLQSTLPLVVHYIGDILLLIMIVIVCFILLRRTKGKTGVIASNPTAVHQRDNIEDEYISLMSNNVQNMPLGSRKNNTSELSTMNANERNGNTTTTIHKGGVTDVYTEMNKTKKLDNSAANEASGNGKIQYENISLRQGAPEFVDPNSTEEKKKRKQRNVEGLVYAELELKDNNSVNNSDIIRRESPVIYAKLRV